MITLFSMHFYSNIIQKYIFLLVHFAKKRNTVQLIALFTITENQGMEQVTRCDNNKSNEKERVFDITKNIGATKYVII